MSRFAQVVVIAQDAAEVMEPLTRPDDERQWLQCFERVQPGLFGIGMWVVEFWRLNWKGLLAHLESLPWPVPDSVQVLIHDEEDHCCGLWMVYDGRLTEVSLPRTERYPYRGSVTGVLSRTDYIGNGVPKDA
ncbi:MULTISPECIES: hypothetical protein [unclassified Streptomyces]|uniref:hypothetical protein n=1 Tax=unclassified Streptomyces TaxID=2593676 RepID=UPI003804EB0D